MSHIFDSKLHQSEFYVYENYVVYLHVYHVRSCSPYSHLQTITIWLPARWAQASLATTNRCNHVYVVLFFILLFMYAVIHCLYSVGNKITTKSNFKLGGIRVIPDSKALGANMGPTWVMSAPDGPHVGPMNLAIWLVAGGAMMFDKGVLYHNHCDTFTLREWLYDEKYMFI